MISVSTEHIEITPGTCGGKPRIAGTRIRVQDVVMWHDQMAMSPEEIVTHYPHLKLADIYAALAYYHDHHDEIRALLRQEEELAASVEAENPSVWGPRVHPVPMNGGTKTLSESSAAMTRTTAAVSIEHLAITPGYSGGKPRIAGHRIKVQHVAVWHERMGMSPDEIVATYPTLTLAEVHAALAYYYDHREEIENDIKEADEFVEKLRDGAPSSSRKCGDGMAWTIRFHLDEHCSTALAEGLRRHGIDVTTTPDAGLSGARDEDHMAYALAEGRVIFTQDDDYLRHHADGVPHAGIAFCHQQSRSMGEMIQGLLLLWNVHEPEDMHNRIEYI